MSTYVIGDIQGCLNGLKLLLDKLSFSPSKDQLWLVGDLVNRGSQSLETLRYIKNLGSSAISVLGNHDLNLLYISQQPRTVQQNNPFIAPVLCAPDRDELLSWLRSCPLIYRDEKKKAIVVHAGIYPKWSLELSLQYAEEIHQLLLNEDTKWSDLYGDSAGPWHEGIQGAERTQFIVNALTRMRFCTLDGKLDFTNKKNWKKNQQSHLYPWFNHPSFGQNSDYTVFFGHWSSSGLVQNKNVVGLDTGYVWGGALTAYCIEATETNKIIQIQT